MEREELQHHLNANALRQTTDTKHASLTKIVTQRSLRLLDDAFTQLRNPKYYTPSEQHLIRALQVGSTAPIAVGSFSLAIQRYPSDIDCQELIYGMHPKQFVPLLQQTLITLLRTPLMFFSDFKAGGVKWTVEELLQGKKSGGLVLDEAVGMSRNPSMPTKLDIIGFTDQRIVEASCFYMLYPTSGQVYILALKADIKKFLTSKPFKAVKRVYSLAKIYNDHDTLAAIEPLIRSTVSLVSQVAADFETLALLAKKTDCVPKQEIIVMIYGALKRLSTIVDLHVPDDIEASINQLGKYFEEAPSCLDDLQKEKVIDICDHIHDRLAEVVNVAAKNYLSTYGVKFSDKYI